MTEPRNFLEVPFSHKIPQRTCLARLFVFFTSVILIKISFELVQYRWKQRVPDRAFQLQRRTDRDGNPLSFMFDLNDIIARE